MQALPKYTKSSCIHIMSYINANKLDAFSLQQNPYLSEILNVHPKVVTHIPAKNDLQSTRQDSL
jgi:hypothetical protein